MRTCTPAFALIVLLAVFAGAGSASATQNELTEEQKEGLQGSLSEEEFHCLEGQVEKLEAAHQGREVDPLSPCEESPNPILPATNELIWAVISFSVLLVVLAKFAFPAIKRGLEGREEAVRSDLEAAEQARAEGEQALSEYRRQIADARNEAALIIEEARQAADAMRRELQESAESEVGAARERAQAEIEQMTSRARSDLQAEMADFAVRLAERVVERNLDRQAQQGLIDEYIAEVGAMSSTGNGAGNGARRVATDDGLLEDYALALLAVARGEGLLDLVEDEMYRVARVFESSDELRQKLADRQIPVGKREAIVEDLLGAAKGKEGATTLTRAIVGFIVAAGRASRLPAIVDAFVDAAAASRQHVVAEVRSAVPLDEDEVERLAAALSRATKKNVEVKVVVDPGVVGGVVAQVGDQIIDGSVRSKLAQLRETL